MLSHEPRVGYAHQPPDVVLDVLAEVGPEVVARKGRLFLLRRSGAPDELARRIASAFYADASFDILPSLSAALTHGFAAHPDAAADVPLAVVVQGLEVYAVGSVDAQLWGGRPEELRELLAPAAERGLWPRGSVYWASDSGPALYGMHWRLVRGDVLVLTTRDAVDALSTRRLRAALRSRGPEMAAQAISRRARRGLWAAPMPVTVLQLGGLKPIPEMGPVRRQTFEPEPAKPRRPREGRSPIWSALVVAAIAVALALWFGRPDLSGEKAKALLIWALTPPPTDEGTASGAPRNTATPQPPVPTMVLFAGTPRPTATSQEPTAQPTTRAGLARSTAPRSVAPDQGYARPRLLHPSSGDAVDGATLTLRWSWEGILADDEYFDVRLWPLGEPKHGIAWTKKQEYVERHLAEGWHTWTVVVIRGENGQVLEELSKEPEPVDFRWSPSAGGHGDPSTAVPTPRPPPTRVTAQPAPTRVTPVANSHD